MRWTEMRDRGEPTVGGVFNALLVGALLQATGSYLTVFIIAGTMYLVALLIIHLLVPRLEPAKLG